MGLALILVLLIVLEVNIGLVNYCSGQSYSDLTYNDKLDSVDKNDSTWKLLTDTVSIFYGYQLKKRVSRWLESANNSSASTNSSANSTDESSLHPTSQPTYISVNTASSAMPTSTPTQEANISSSNNTILLQPSSMPTVGSSSPTSSPTYVPTILPANRSYNPSSSPSLAPNSNFSFTPTSMPTSVPSSPTSVPTSAPSTHCPSSSPSSQPTSFPSLAPTSSPTSMPTPPGIVGKNWYYTVTAQCFLLGDGVDDQYYIDEMNTAINQVFQFLLKDPLEDAQSELIDVFAVRKTALPLGRKLSSSLFHTTESSVRYDLEVWCPNHDLALQVRE